MRCNRNEILLASSFEKSGAFLCYIMFSIRPLVPRITAEIRFACIFIHLEANLWVYFELLLLFDALNGSK